MTGKDSGELYMEKKKIQTDKEGKELRQPLDGKFPIAAEFQKLSYYAYGLCISHWHPEMELLVVTEGALEQRIGEETHMIRENEGVFINSHVMHGARMVNREDCSYRVIRFEPALLGGNAKSLIYEKYVKTLQSQKDLRYRIVRPEDIQQRRMIDLIYRITDTYVKREVCYELKVQQMMLELWELLYKRTGHVEENAIQMNRELYKIQDALAYIQMYYKNPMMLEDIAGACMLSKSSCCRLFKKVFRQSPMEYVTSYRIQQSFMLIADDRYSITEIAYESGFTNSSYFTEMFRKVIGMTPTQYKKEICGK